MSITIPQPSMALNSHDVPGAKYRMWNTWDVPANDNPGHILGWCASVASGATDGYLRVLIINCHGWYSGSGRGATGGFGLSLGTGIRRAHTGLFSVLRGKVANIWITACGTARITTPGTSGDGDGNLFCQEIARAANTYVVAATTHQVGDLWLGQNEIDDFEGLVVRYNPSGAMDWSQDYGRNPIEGLINGWN
jgi:hypothetical protein